MSNDRPTIPNCDEKVEALDAADRLITRLQDTVAEQLPPDSGLDAEDAYGEIIAELETAPEVDQVREALGRDPDRFGSADRPAPREGNLGSPRRASHLNS